MPFFDVAALDLVRDPKDSTGSDYPLVGALENGFNGQFRGNVDCRLWWLLSASVVVGDQTVQQTYYLSYLAAGLLLVRRMASWYQITHSQPL